MSWLVTFNHRFVKPSVDSGLPHSFLELMKHRFGSVIRCEYHITLSLFNPLLRISHELVYLGLLLLMHASIAQFHRKLRLLAACAGLTHEL